MFQEWMPPEYGPVVEDAAMPESPLFCPRTTFVTITDDPLCSRSTYELLCDMRDLTDLVIAQNASPSVIHGVDTEETNCVAASAVDYESRIAAICARLRSLPSAYTAGLATSNDWIFEACRITALIYTGSVIQRVNFSVAAHPANNPLVSSTEIHNHPRPDKSINTFRLTSALLEVLKRTDIDNVWSDMAGVLYWISAVGAAAARTSIPMNAEPNTLSNDESYMVWVRRCLTLYATRTMIVLVFQHPMPIVLAQKTLLRIQEIIGIRDSKRLVAWNSKSGSEIT